MRLVQRRLSALCLAVAVWFAPNGSAGAEPVGSADAGGKSVAEEVLDILRAAGQISDEKYESLRNRARKEESARIEAAVERALEKAMLANASTPPVTDGPKDWTFKWSNGFKLERNDGEFKLKFGGRIQNDWALIDLDDTLEDDIRGEGNGTEIRRTRLFFEGIAFEYLIFKAQFDFANTGDGNVDIRDLWMGLKGLGPLGTIKVGHFKEPFSLEQLGSSKYMTFLERGLPNVFIPGRNSGFMLTNNALDKNLVWAVGVFKDTNDSGFGFNDKSLWNVTTRLAGTLIYADAGERVVHLGFSYSHQFRGDDFMLRYSQRPEVHLANRFADTGSVIPTNDIDIINAEFATVFGPFSVQAEYMHSFVDGRNRENLDFWGTYILASYFLTAEHRNYQHGKASFGRTELNENFNPAEGEWGAWEIAARFSYLDLDDHFADGGTLWDVTAALNWYLYPNARVMVNYVHSQLNGRTVLGPPSVDGVDGAMDAAQVRFQIDF